MGNMKKKIGSEKGEVIMNDERKVIEWEQGWNVMRKGITKLKNLVEGVPEQ